MGRKAIPMLGQKFGRLLVVSIAKPRFRGGFAWHCRCDCGTEKIVAGHLLRRGQVKSCGCLRAEVGRRGLKKLRLAGIASRMRHGEARPGSETAEWKLWASIKKRCAPNHAKVWPAYAGRGIRLCKEWANSYERFVSDIGRRPSTQHTLDRIRNDRGYEPGNVRWATRKEQARNRTTSLFIKCGAHRRTLSEWCERTGLKNTTILARLRRGWTPRKALSEPVKKKAQP